MRIAELEVYKSLSCRILGRNIKAARDRLELTQEQVAQKLGIGVHHYGRIERGVAHPNLTRLEEICEILSIPIESVFLGVSDRSEFKNYPQGASGYAKILQGVTKNLDEKHKEAVLQICEIIANL